MARSKHLAAMFLLSVCSVMLLSACSEKSEAPSETPTAVATAATPAPKGTVQPGSAVVTSPKEAEKVTVPITVSGTASVFEGTLDVAIESADGSRTFCRAVTTASQGAPGAGTFEVILGFPPPPFTPPLALGGRVHVFTQSPKDGSIQDLAIVPFVIASDEPNILINSPLCDAQVKSPVTISGTASVFEAALTLVVKDSSGNELASADIMASEGAPGKGTFSQELTFSLSGGAQLGTIEAFNRSAEDGSVINLFSVPVMLMP